MQAFIMTKAVPFGKEEYVGVAKTRKVAENKFRSLYPHMRSEGGSATQFVSDKNNTLLLFIKEDTILE